MTPRRLAFITSTRSDYAKQQPYIRFFAGKMPLDVFVTSMHLNPQLGLGKTAIEGDWRLYKNVSLTWDVSFPHKQPLARQLAHLVQAVSGFLQDKKIEFLFVHGDRLESLAGVLAASFLNIPVCQIEAGDLSGNIDEAYRHALTKLAQRFLVDDEPARQIVLKLGEDPRSIFVTGNTSLAQLPAADEQQQILDKYGLKAPFCVVLYHPQTGLSSSAQYAAAAQMVQTLNQCPGRLAVISPNNDPGYEEILQAYNAFNPAKTLFLKSLPCREFLAVLNHAVCLIGNSSSGFKEAPLLGVPSVNIGSRQSQRETGRQLPKLITVPNVDLLPQAVKQAFQLGAEPRKPVLGAAVNARFESIFTDDFFAAPLQKKFYSL